VSLRNEPGSKIPLKEQLKKLLEETSNRINASACALTDMKGLPLAIAGYDEKNIREGIIELPLIFYILGEKLSKITGFGSLNLLIMEFEDSLIVTKRLEEAQTPLNIFFQLKNSTPLGLILFEMGRLEKNVQNLLAQERESAEKQIEKGAENEELLKILDRLERDPFFKNLVKSSQSGREEKGNAHA